MHKRAKSTSCTSLQAATSSGEEGLELVAMMDSDELGGRGVAIDVVRFLLWPSLAKKEAVV
jgi:hypothetical protein